MPKTTVIRHRATALQLEASTGLVPSVIARDILDEASRWLGEPLPGRYAAGLAHRARRFFVYSPRHRRRWIASPKAGRDWLNMFMRHWLASRLHAERPALFAQLPESYYSGQPLPARPAPRAKGLVSFSNEDHCRLPDVAPREPRDESPVLLSNEARLLLSI